MGAFYLSPARVFRGPGYPLEAGTGLAESLARGGMEMVRLRA